MNIAVAIDTLLKTLSPIYGEGEAKSIVKIIGEDVFNTIDLGNNRLLNPSELKDFQYIHQQLSEGQPLQYVLGMADFYGYKFHVNQSVLIPRQETEELVYLILEKYKKAANKITALDIGTGSGCIPIVLKKELPNLEMHALDISLKALATAQKNAKEIQVEVLFHHLDILDIDNHKTLPFFDFIVSNPPYIPHKEAHLVPDFVKNYEPKIALFVENEDPLLFYRTITIFAKKQLKKGGKLFFETNEFNAKDVVKLLENNGFSEVELVKDMSGKERIVLGMLDGITMDN